MHRSFRGIVSLFAVLLAILPTYPSKSQPNQNNCEKLFKFAKKVNPTDVPGKCYVGNSANLTVFQWINENQGLALLDYGYFKKIISIIPHTDIVYGKLYTFVYRGTITYLTTLRAPKTVAVFEVYDYDPFTTVKSFFILKVKDEPQEITVKLIPTNTKQKLSKKNVLGILRIERERGETENKCSLELKGHYSNLDPSVQINLLDALCTREAMRGKPIRVKLNQ